VVFGIDQEGVADYIVAEEEGGRECGGSGCRTWDAVKRVWPKAVVGVGEGPSAASPSKIDRPLKPPKLPCTGFPEMISFCSLNLNRTGTA